MKLEFAEKYGVHPARVGETSVLWWERDKVWTYAKASRAALQAAKRYPKITDAPRSILRLVSWAHEDNQDGE